MKPWRESVDPSIKPHLEAQIRETLQHENSYNSAKDKGKAQLWIAVANLSKQILSLELKIKYIENVLKDMILKINELKEQPTKIIKDLEKQTKKKPNPLKRQRKKLKRKNRFYIVS